MLCSKASKKSFLKPWCTSKDLVISIFEKYATWEESKNPGNHFSLRGDVDRSRKYFPKHYEMFEVVFLSRQCVWLEKHICSVCFLRWPCQVIGNKKQALLNHLLRCSSPSADWELQYIPTVHCCSFFFFFNFNALCGLAQFRFEPGSKKKKKKPKWRKGLCKMYVFILHCMFLTIWLCDP